MWWYEAVCVPGPVLQLLMLLLLLLPLTRCLQLLLQLLLLHRRLLLGGGHTAHEVERVHRAVVVQPAYVP
jgi:hypothetical protein